MIENKLSLEIVFKVFSQMHIIYKYYAVLGGRKKSIFLTTSPYPKIKPEETP